MEDYNYIQYKEHGGLQLYTVERAWGTATIYSRKSMEDWNCIKNSIQYKEHGGMQLYTGAWRTVYNIKSMED